jgi:hypothetical protein
VDTSWLTPLHIVTLGTEPDVLVLVTPDELSTWVEGARLIEQLPAAVTGLNARWVAEIKRNVSCFCRREKVHGSAKRNLDNIHTTQHNTGMRQPRAVQACSLKCVRYITLNTILLAAVARW